MKYLYSILALLAFGLQATAFDEIDLKEGLVIEVDLPGGCSVLVPAYFVVDKAEEDNPNNVSFNDPEGYIFCGANLLPEEFMKFDEFAQTYHKELKDSLPSETKLGDLQSKHFTLGDTQDVLLYYILLKEENMGFFHLLAELDEGILDVSITVTGKEEGRRKNIDLEFSRLILLSLKTSTGLKLKPANLTGDGNSE